jgi:hypothetical protein
MEEPSKNLQLSYTSKFSINQEVYWMRYNEIVKAVVANIEFNGASVDRTGKVFVNKTRYYVHGKGSEWIDEEILHKSKEEIIDQMIEKFKNL